MKTPAITTLCLLLSLLFAGCPSLPTQSTKQLTAALAIQQATITAIIDTLVPPELTGEAHIKIFTPLPVMLDAYGLRRVPATDSVPGHWTYTYLYLAGFSQLNANTVELGTKPAKQ